MILYIKKVTIFLDGAWHPVSFKCFVQMLAEEVKRLELEESDS
jgi:hypothetical protein